MDDKQYAQTILTELGGEKNLISMQHCVTRLRLSLKDNNLFNKEAIEKLPIVQGVVFKGNTYQIVLGGKVTKIANEITKITGISEDDEGSAESNLGVKMSIPKRVIDYMTGSIAPIVPALMAAGMISALVSLLTFAGVLAEGSTTHTLLSAFGTAGLYFIPIMLAVSASRKLKCSTYLSVLMAGILLMPEFIALVAAGEPITLFGLPVTAINYGSTFIPILLVMPFLALVERLFSKWIRGVLTPILVPAITILITAPVALIALAPLAHTISGWLSYGVNFIYYNTSIFGGLIVGAMSPFIVLTGLHTAIAFPILMSELTVDGTCLYIAILTMANLAVGGAAMGVALRAKNKTFRGEAFGSGFTGLFGVTEPALFGVLLRVKRPLIAAGIASGIGGAACIFFDIRSNGLGGAGILSFPMYFGTKLVPFLVVGIATVIIAALAAYFIGYNHELVQDDGE